MFKSSLDGVVQKLVRADEHLKAVLEVTSGLRYGECNIVREEDAERNLGFLRVRLPKVPPTLSPIIGDFLYNVRCALDHMICRLSGNALVRIGEERHHLSFPICKTPEAFLSVKAQRLGCLPEKVQAAIELLQPYSTGNSSLMLLSELHNIDKHCNLNLITVVASDAAIDWSRGSDTFLQSFIGNDELRDGAVFGDIAIPLSNPRIAERFRNPNVQVKGQAAIFVAFDDPTAESLEPFRVDAVLEGIFQFVRDEVFWTLEPFFD